METLGNVSLLERHRIGFLAGSEVAPLSVIPTFDWAAEVAKREDVAVVSGFHSMIERQVLDFLLRGRWGIVCVLARSLYSNIPPEFRESYAKGQVLFVTEERQRRVSKDSAHRRNRLVLTLADEMTLPSVSTASSLHSLLHNYLKPITRL